MGPERMQPVDAPRSCPEQTEAALDIEKRAGFPGSQGQAGPSSPSPRSGVCKALTKGGRNQEAPRKGRDDRTVGPGSALYLTFGKGHSGNIEDSGQRRMRPRVERQLETVRTIR